MEIDFRFPQSLDRYLATCYLVNVQRCNVSFHSLTLSNSNCYQINFYLIPSATLQTISLEKRKVNYHKVTSGWWGGFPRFALSGCWTTSRPHSFFRIWLSKNKRRGRNFRRINVNTLIWINQLYTKNDINHQNVDSFPLGKNKLSTCRQVLRHFFRPKLLLATRKRFDLKKSSKFTETSYGRHFDTET